MNGITEQLASTVIRPTNVLVVGHGSREGAANREFENLVSAYQKTRPHYNIRTAYIELTKPSLETALFQWACETDRLLIFPFFLFSAGHVKNDIPLALWKARKRFPQIQINATCALGVHPYMTDVLFDRIESVSPYDAKTAQRTVVLVVGRGSSDADANSDFCKLVRLFYEKRPFAHVLPAFIGITKPSVEESLEIVARIRPERLLIVPYFFFGGRLVNRLKDQLHTFSSQFPWIKTQLAPYLTEHPKLFALMDERLDSAVEHRSTLPCDTCQYRPEVSTLSENVGGLKALLWSLRHTYTHTQAMPHTHAHLPLRKHILVCTNVDCAERGSVSLVENLRRTLKDRGCKKDIQVTRTSCMGRCGEGPTVAVYPDGIWYRNVTTNDVADIVDDHLLGDRLVTRLVDNIMQ